MKSNVKRFMEPLSSLMMERNVIMLTATLMKDVEDVSSNETFQSLRRHLPTLANDHPYIHPNPMWSRRREEKRRS